MPEIGPAEARRRVAAGEAVLVDSRVRGMGRRARPRRPAPGPLGHLDPAEFAGRSVITTCRGGGRGSRAAQALHEAGADAVSLHGGSRAWAEDGGAIVRDDGSSGGLD